MHLPFGRGTNQHMPLMLTKCFMAIITLPYFCGNIDYLTSKPLLTRWIQMFSITTLGYNELAIRLPSAIAGILTAYFVFAFIKKISSVAWAWCAFCVLITSIGFVHFHTARTGEPDSVLTLFLFLSNTYLFYYAYKKENRDQNIFLYFIFLGLAFGTKSIAALLFIPAHIFIILYQKKVKDILLSKGFYLGLFAFLLISAFFILSRQFNDPAYISSMLNNDILRLTNAIEGHNEPSDFFFNNFYNSRFSCWVAFFLLGVFLLWHHRRKPKLKMVLAWSISLILSQLLIISFSSTKLEWYDMPLYPYMAIVAGYGIYYCIKRLKYFNPNTIRFPFVIVLLFSIPLYFAIKQSMTNNRTEGERKLERVADYLFMKENEGFNFNNYYVSDDWYIGQPLFYKYKLKEDNQNLYLVDTTGIKPNTKLIVSDTAIKSYIMKKYNYVVSDTYYNVSVFDIKENR